MSKPRLTRFEQRALLAIALMLPLAAWLLSPWLGRIFWWSLTFRLYLLKYILEQ